MEKVAGMSGAEIAGAATIAMIIRIVAGPLTAGIAQDRGLRATLAVSMAVSFAGYALLFPGEGPLVRRIQCFTANLVVCVPDIKRYSPAGKVMVSMFEVAFVLMNSIINLPVLSKIFTSEPMVPSSLKNTSHGFGYKEMMDDSSVTLRSITENSWMAIQSLASVTEAT
jgi:hypothetical protein